MGDDPCCGAVPPGHRSPPLEGPHRCSVPGASCRPGRQARLHRRFAEAGRFGETADPLPGGGAASRGSPLGMLRQVPRPRCHPPFDPGRASRGCRQRHHHHPGLDRAPGTTGTAARPPATTSGCTPDTPAAPWDSAQAVEGLPAPQPAGQAKSFTVGGLATNHVYVSPSGPSTGRRTPRLSVIPSRGRPGTRLRQGR